MLDTMKFLIKAGQSAPFSDSVETQTNPDMSQMSDDDLLK